MKASEIRGMSFEEMIRKVDDLKEELLNLRFRHETDQLETLEPALRHYALAVEICAPDAQGYWLLSRQQLQPESSVPCQPS